MTIRSRPNKTCDAFTYPIDYLFRDRIHRSCHGHSELRPDAGLNEKKASEIVAHKSTIVLLTCAKALTMCQTCQAKEPMLLWGPKPSRLYLIWARRIYRENVGLICSMRQMGPPSYSWPSSRMNPGEAPSRIQMW